MSYTDWYGNEIIPDMNENDLADIIIGHAVTHIDEHNNTLTLDNGTVLEFQDEHDCCAWFNAELHAGNLTSNAVTHVKVTNNVPEGEWGDEDYTIHILAENTKIADLDINGNPTSGYYCHSISLKVREKEQA